MSGNRTTRGLCKQKHGPTEKKYYPTLPSIITTSHRNMTTSSTGSLQQFGEKHVTKGLGRLTEGIMSKGTGSYVTFEDGRRMLDFTCGIGVTGLG
jgi:4-aminobutyrate aminotransferase